MQSYYHMVVGLFPYVIARLLMSPADVIIWLRNS